tara:strand:+ start:2329 stop:5886 length:3558 start_codon:yes stop_codon:yes gene_type:complete
MSLQSSNNDTPKDITQQQIDKNRELNETELQNRDEISREETEYSYLYPSLDDANFTSKISQRKEFYDTRYEKPLGSIEEVSDKLCNAEFELAPHQMFVRNFLSFQTPYNGLLLYHGLGSGKTCSAISVSEEMRAYLKQMGIVQRIIVVASPNVQDNFRKQLFDENKLKLVDGLWNIRACTGNKFLSEINPMNMKGLTKEKVVAQVKRIINISYLFLGYIEFANYINKRSTVGSDLSAKQREKIVKQKLNRIFSNRLIIIDEVHNIRMTPDNSDKRVAVELEKLVSNVENMRLLFLSATPMYNSYKEIIWLIGILNKNDGRSVMSTKDVFTSDGNFKIGDDGEEIGKELLMRKATGYVSFVRGENPYTFPFRIWPMEFSPENTYQNILKPTIQLNGRSIAQPIEMLSVYLANIGDVQEISYRYIIDRLKKGAGQDPLRNMPSFENMEAFGYTLLQRPLEALNMVYPDSRLTDEADIDSKDLVGKGGLQRIMKYDESTTPLFKGNFQYKTEEYGHIFSPDQIGRYSGKIKNICDSIVNSKGIVLIYSQYLDGGLVPISLALEEIGFKRAGQNKSLFKTPPTEEIDALSFKPKGQHGDNFNQASYVIISGDKALSPDNAADVTLATQQDNVDGSKVKVIMISQAGSEGIDFKFIRQVHVLDPWYNMNRIEQIIGRAVRTCSHKDVPFKDRNVEIYLYGSLLNNIREEAADIYLYRLAELKAIQIGQVTRALKESSVDCLLNFEQAGFTVEQMNMTVKQELSSGQIINFSVGDRPFSSTCDYMNKCSYKCKPIENIDPDKISFDTYNESFITMNSDKIIQRVRDSFKERFYYKKDDLIGNINAVKNYPLLQINAALNQLTEDKNEFLIDMYGRMGRLINIGQLYLFQPLEISDSHISIYDRSVPVEYKHNKLLFEVPREIEEAVIKIRKKKVSKVAKNDDGEKIINEMRDNYTLAHTPQDIEAKSDNWYAFCSLVYPKLESEGWSRKLLDKLLVHHMIESLRFLNKLELLNYLPKYDSKDDMTRFIKEYFSNNMMSAKGLTAIMLQNTGKLQLVVSRDKKTFGLAQPEDILDFKEKLDEMKATFMPMTNKLASHIGFMVNFKKDYMVFKIRDMSKPRNTGARCDQASKVKSIRFLNELGEEQYTSKTKMSRHELCIVQEFLLRKFDIEKKDGKKWFLRPSEAIIVNDPK